LKRKLWRFSDELDLVTLDAKERSAEVGLSASGEKEIPLLCHEACNLLVAACRETVKKRERAASAATPQ
jgi:hypothetical protein